MCAKITNLSKDSSADYLVSLPIDSKADFLKTRIKYIENEPNRLLFVGKYILTK